MVVINSLKFNDVTLKFGGITALNNVSFEVKPKTLYAIIGPNGAGKTSIFNCISGIYRPTEGSVSFGEKGYLSGGEQQMLAIGRALMSNPNYLLLDEPSLGLAPKLVDQIAELITEINSQGVTVLLVEQNANMALNVSSHGYIMETGNIVMDNPSQELLQDEDVREFYLGLNPEGTNRKSFKDVKHYKRKKRWLS